MTIPVKWTTMAATAIDMMLSNGFQSKKKEDPENKDNLWSSILAEVQNSSSNKLPSNKNILVLEYTEPGDELDPGNPLRRTSRNLDDETMDTLPLLEGIVTTNLGLDIVVVITKTDYMSTLEKEHDYKDEHFDFIQQWIRRFCFQYGAALFYTSAKEDKNCDLLYKYLTHRIYSLPFRTPALVVEKDAVLIPAGWDNMKKISILHENLQSMKPDDYYRDVIAQPSTNRKCVAREVEVQAEEEQAFLAKQQAALLGIKDPTLFPTSRNQASTGPVIQVASPNKKLDPKNAGTMQSGEGVLANFFNSLLHKKTGSPGSVGTSPIKIGNHYKNSFLISVLIQLGISFLLLVLFALCNVVWFTIVSVRVDCLCLLFTIV
ncbi:cytoplasmic dynein 1 light intermediate chain 1-like, partial [Ceratina calcarata]|uniref:Dynein light intermediate chain n=1 Tax=Ceratina calcarata TaxID=156304 RepID=A0AAJ7IS90_9HYME